jgi:hypothetical protein
LFNVSRKTIESELAILQKEQNKEILFLNNLLLSYRMPCLKHLLAIVICYLYVSNIITFSRNPSCLEILQVLKSSFASPELVLLEEEQVEDDKARNDAETSLDYSINNNSDDDFDKWDVKA